MEGHTVDDSDVWWWGSSTRPRRTSILIQRSSMPDDLMEVPESSQADALSTPSFIPRQLSFPLPHSPSTHVHIHLSQLGSTTTSTSLLLFLTTTSSATSSSSLAPLGSFVYALPSARASPASTTSSSRAVLATPLYARESSLEFTTRLARLLAGKIKRPVYVGSSVSFMGAGMGGTVEEEVDGLRKCVEVVMSEMDR